MCAALIACSGLLVACAQEASGPVTMGSAPDHPSGSVRAGLPQTDTPMKSRSIIVKPGQSVGGIAEAYHVSTRAIIAANHLMPPYELKVGARLLIPVAAAWSTAKAAVPQHSRPPSADIVNASQPHSRPKRPPPEVIPLDDPAPALSSPTDEKSAAEKSAE